MKNTFSLLIIALSIFWGTSICFAQTLTTLHTFAGYSKDGAVGQMPNGPYGGFVADKAGNLYGTTPFGGTSAFCDEEGTNVGCGTVFQLVPPQAQGGSWTQNLLYSFLPNFTGDGFQPTGGLAIDAKGNLYGTTASGQGTLNSGIAFELSPPAQQGGPWAESIIYTFGQEGHNPNGSLIMDSAGNLYGTTNEGGAHQAGVAFELSPPAAGQQTWTETVLYSFGANNNDGSYPLSGLIMDKKGNLYGTTTMGGGSGWGTVFQLVPGKSGSPWIENVLYRFTGSTDGGDPEGGLLIHGTTLYGTTRVGEGNVFSISVEGGHVVESVIYAFKGVPDGADPRSALIVDPSGNFYGTTTEQGENLAGNVYRLSHNSSGWTQTVLYSFTGGSDGGNPTSPLILKNGALIGMTSQGGDMKCFANLLNGCGTTFEITP